MIPRLLLALLPLALLCSCASTERRVIATKHTTLQQQTILAEYPVSMPDKSE